MAKKNGNPVEKTADDFYNDFLSDTSAQGGEIEDLSQYEEEQASSFPPYWQPGLGKGFVGRVVDLDARDPEFLRYVIEAAKPTICGIGPVSNGEVVTVGIGERFTLSVYKSLPLHHYMMLEDPIIVVCVGRLPIKGRAQDMWRFRIKTSGRDHATLIDRKKGAEHAELDERIKRAFQIAHTVKDGKTAVKALLAGGTQ